jgi:hypothetical protein
MGHTLGAAPAANVVVIVLAEVAEFGALHFAVSTICVQ